MQDWIGKTQRLRDGMDPARAQALHATLGREGDPPQNTLPSFWHHIYFWDPHAPHALGEDGHPRTGRGLIPDLGLPQRMWAGGALRFHAPLKLGVLAEKTSRLANIQLKEGRSGPLGFVTLEHEIHQNGQLCVAERQDLVYRMPPRDRRTATPPIARTDELYSETACFDTVMLFRYSALTFNGHRFHYDLDHAREVEGYAWLIVHGPLLVQGLISLAERRLSRPLSQFSFRASAPLLHLETAELCIADQGDAWVRGPDGRQCVTAKLR